MAAILAAITLLSVAWWPASPRGEDTLLVEDRFFGSFENATRITVDAKGSIFVIDESANSLVVFDSPDRVPRMLGGFGWDQTTFDRPTGVATDLLNIYVADFGNHRVSRFDRQLTFLSSLATRDTSFERARFGYPKGVALSRQGDLFVLDGENTRVVKFDARSRFERSFGDTGPSEGRLQKPVKLLVSRDERVLVLEQDRIVEYDYSGNFVLVIQSAGLSGARGFCVFATGIIVATADRLLFFDQQNVQSWSIELSHVVASKAVKPLQDVACWNDSIILLTPKTAGMFKMVRGK